MTIAAAIQQKGLMSAQMVGTVTAFKDTKARAECGKNLAATTNKKQKNARPQDGMHNSKAFNGMRSVCRVSGLLPGLAGTCQLYRTDLAF
jgi:hypothetical protein